MTETAGRILLVDDDPVFTRVMARGFERRGFITRRCGSAEEALAACAEFEPSHILLDLNMPRMNGLDLVSYIRNSSQWNPLPVVMITSRTMAKHRQQAERAGVNSYITKPFTEDEVLASIDRELAPRPAL